jgi:hypothetical protein
MYAHPLKNEYDYSTVTWYRKVGFFGGVGGAACKPSLPSVISACLQGSSRGCRLKKFIGLGSYIIL